MTSHRTKSGTLAGAQNQQDGSQPAKEPALFPRFRDTPYFVGHSIRFDTPRRRANVQH